MSDVEKIMSDVIQTTSDLFSPTCNTMKTKTLQEFLQTMQNLDIQQFAKFAPFAAECCRHHAKKKAAPSKRCGL